MDILNKVVVSTFTKFDMEVYWLNTWYGNAFYLTFPKFGTEFHWVNRLNEIALGYDRSISHWPVAT